MHVTLTSSLRCEVEPFRIRTISEPLMRDAGIEKVAYAVRCCCCGKMIDSPTSKVFAGLIIRAGWRLAVGLLHELCAGTKVVILPLVRKSEDRDTSFVSIGLGVLSSRLHHIPHSSRSLVLDTDQFLPQEELRPRKNCLALALVRQRTNGSATFLGICPVNTQAARHSPDALLLPLDLQTEKYIRVVLPRTENTPSQNGSRGKKTKDRYVNNSRRFLVRRN